jgi:hypothetical protein
VTRVRSGACRVALLAVIVAGVAGAQRPSAAMPFRPAFRLDLITDRDPSLQAALGVGIVTAYNTRLSVDVGGGAVSRATGTRAAARVDLLGRWLSDPFGQGRWGLNAGGGVGLRAEPSAAPRVVALVVVGLEGRSDGQWVRGVEVGLGGGVRAGVTVKRALPRRR